MPFTLQATETWWMGEKRGPETWLKQKRISWVFYINRKKERNYFFFDLGNGVKPCSLSQPGFFTAGLVREFNVLISAVNLKEGVRICCSSDLCVRVIFITQDKVPQNIFWEILAYSEIAKELRLENRYEKNFMWWLGFGKDVVLKGWRQMLNWPGHCVA